MASTPTKIQDEGTNQKEPIQKHIQLAIQSTQPPTITSEEKQPETFNPPDLTTPQLQLSKPLPSRYDNDTKEEEEKIEIKVVEKSSKNKWFNLSIDQFVFDHHIERSKEEQRRRWIERRNIEEERVFNPDFKHTWKTFVKLIYRKIRIRRKKKKKKRRKRPKKGIPGPPRNVWLHGGCHFY